MTDAKIPAHIQSLVDEYREPLGLDRWDIRLEVGAMPADDVAKAACSASPEYREATILFDLDRLKTGDDLEELVAHELGHCPLWPLHEEAEGLAEALADCFVIAGAAQAAVRKVLQEEVRKAAERTATDIGHILLRYHRRLRDTRHELATLKKEMKELKRVSA